MIADRFHMSAPRRDRLGLWNVDVRRAGARPAGGTASGATPEKAQAGAMEIVQDVLRYEQQKEQRR